MSDCFTLRIPFVETVLGSTLYVHGEPIHLWTLNQRGSWTINQYRAHSQYSSSTYKAVNGIVFVWLTQCTCILYVWYIDLHFKYIIFKKVDVTALQAVQKNLIRSFFFLFWTNYVRFFCLLKQQHICRHIKAVKLVKIWYTLNLICL